MCASKSSASSLAREEGAAANAQRPEHGTILVLALGNPLRGDDGAGQAVLESLSSSRLPGDVVRVDGGTAGLETALVLEGYELAIILDAADMGLLPGEWRRLEYPDCEAVLRPKEAPRGVHEAGLAEALALASELGTLPRRVTLFAIQPGKIGWGSGLSASVSAAVPDVSRHVIDAILSCGGGGDGKDPDYRR